MAQYQLRRRVLPSAFEIRQEFEARDANAAIVIAQERATIPAVELWEDGTALCKLVLEPVGCARSNQEGANAAIPASS